MTARFAARSVSATGEMANMLALLAAVVVVAPTPEVMRAPAVLAFALLAPGAAIAALLGIRAPAPSAMVILVGSLTVNLLASELAVLVGWWEPESLLLVIAAACAVAAAVVRQRGEVAPV